MGREGQDRTSPHSQVTRRRLAKPFHGYDHSPRQPDQVRARRLGSAGPGERLRPDRCKRVCVPPGDGTDRSFSRPSAYRILPLPNREQGRAGAPGYDRNTARSLPCRDALSDRRRQRYDVRRERRAVSGVRLREFRRDRRIQYGRSNRTRSQRFRGTNRQCVGRQQCGQRQCRAHVRGVDRQCRRDRPEWQHLRRDRWWHFRRHRNRGHWYGGKCR